MIARLRDGFWVFPGLPGLLVGQVVGGLGIRMITATATAHLNDCTKPTGPTAGPGLFEVVSTGANVGGIALGPLIAGALTQYVTEPLAFLHPLRDTVSARDRRRRRRP